MLAVAKIINTYLNTMHSMLEGCEESTDNHNVTAASSYERVYKSVRTELILFMKFAIKYKSYGILIDGGGVYENAAYIQEEVMYSIEDMDFKLKNLKTMSRVNNL